MVVVATSTMLDDFPPELFDNIFDFLVDDKASLHACTTVSHRWHQLSRRYKFAIVKVTGWNRRFEGFFSFCLAQQDVVANIRELTFVGGSELTPGGHKSAYPFQYADFIAILPTLRSLRKICFRAVQIGGDLRLLDARGTVQAPLACLDVLEIVQTGKMPAERNFLEFLSSLLSMMSVDMLKISGRVDSTRDLAAGVQPINKSVNLRQLVFPQGEAMPNLLGFFEEILVSDCLRAVTLQCTHDIARHSHGIAHMRFLSSDVARSLVSVDLDLGTSAKPPDIPEAAQAALGEALARCTQLMYLRLGIVGWCNSSCIRRGSTFYAPNPQPPLLVPLLASLPSAFRVLALRLRVRCLENGDWWTDCVPYWDLEALDDIFASRTEHFPDLQRVIFDVYPDAEDRCVKTLQEYDAPLLPKLQASGKLRVRVVREPWTRALEYPFFPDTE